MNIENYNDIFGDYIISSHNVNNSFIISRFDTLLVPGEENLMIGEVHKNGKAYVYSKTPNNDLSRIRNKSKRKRLDTAPGLHQ